MSTGPNFTLDASKIFGNRYQLHGLIGRGTFGEVYRADDLKYNPPRHVAIKMLHNKFLNDVEVRADIAREASILAQFSHPNILRILDFDISQQQAYIVMELAEGGSLAQRIRPDLNKPSTQMPLDKVVSYLEQICNALDEAHKAGLVHRDLKPLNILLDKWDRPLIADFGLATAVSSSQQSVMVDVATSGTPPYMAPQQWSGFVGRASDIYAIGIITYQLITGEVPFQGDTNAIGFQHINAPIPPLSFRAPGIKYPPELDKVMAKALAKNPKERFRTGKDFANEFKGALNFKYLYPPTEQVIYPIPVPVPPRPGPDPNPSLKKNKSKIGPALIAVLVVGLITTMGILAAVLFSGIPEPTPTSVGSRGIVPIVTATATVAPLTSTPALTFTPVSTPTLAQTQAPTPTNVPPTATPVPPTATRVPPTPTRAVPTATPGPKDIAAALDKEATLVVGPLSGSLTHRSDNKFSTKDFDNSLKNFAIGLNFYNPYSASYYGFDYGFIFRNQNSGKETYLLLLTSSGDWSLVFYNSYNTGNSSKVVIKGHYSGLNTKEAARNSMVLYVKDNKGYFYINGDFIQQLNLSDLVDSGTISVGTTFLDEDTRPGEVTDYSDLSIYSLL